ncbi:hypothetical protein ACFDWB_005325 [Salmonella enterica]
MKKYISLLSVGMIMLALSACHQKPVKSIVTPEAKVLQHEIPSLELLPLSEFAHDGWTKIELVGRTWYIDTDSILTRNELLSLSFEKNKDNILLHIIPNEQGGNKINSALRKKDNYILMVLNGRAISLSKIQSPQGVLFYVGDKDTTIKVAEDISQKKISY